MNFFLAFATMVQLLGAATFPDDDVRWTLGELDPVVVDSQTGVVVYTAVPSAWVGCAAPRFTVDSVAGVVLAVHCATARGYELLAH